MLVSEPEAIPPLEAGCESIMLPAVLDIDIALSSDWLITLKPGIADDVSTGLYGIHTTASLTADAAGAVRTASTVIVYSLRLSNPVFSYDVTATSVDVSLVTTKSPCLI